MKWQLECTFTFITQLLLLFFCPHDAIADKDSQDYISYVDFSFPYSIRQYELKVHEDLNMNKVYTGELGRLKSFENQKPYVILQQST